MLKKISPLISPELLKILAEMGHGDVTPLATPISLRNPAKPRMWYGRMGFRFLPCWMRSWNCFPLTPLCRSRLS